MSIFDRIGPELGIIWHVLGTCDSACPEDSLRLRFSNCEVSKNPQVWDGIQEGRLRSGEVGSEVSCGGTL